MELNRKYNNINIQKTKKREKGSEGNEDRNKWKDREKIQVRIRDDWRESQKDVELGPQIKIQFQYE